MPILLSELKALPSCLVDSTFRGIADTEYVLGVLVPETYAVTAVHVSSGDARWEMENQHLRFFLENSEETLIDWSARFTRSK